MKLGDPTHGLKGSDLERVRLEGEDLRALTAFWDGVARVDAVHAIADSATDDDFERSGEVDAAALRLLVPQGGRVLEIGCGIGRVLQHLGGHCSEVHGVDISAEMVAQGTRRLAHLPNVHFHAGNGYDLGEFEDGSFDLVFSGFVFQHVPKTIAFNYWTEANRVLRPDGLFRLQVPNLLVDEHFAAFRHFSQPYFVENPYPMNFYTPAEVSRMLLAAGFAIDAMSEEIVVLARKGAHRAGLDLGEGGMAQEQRTRLEARIAELEMAVAQMRRVYEHPAIRAARRLKRRFRSN